jgi:hypothetical protein
VCCNIDYATETHLLGRRPKSAFRVIVLLMSDRECLYLHLLEACANDVSSSG